MIKILSKKIPKYLHVMIQFWNSPKWSYRKRNFECSNTYAPPCSVQDILDTVHIFSFNAAQCSLFLGMSKGQESKFLDVFLTYYQAEKGCKTKSMEFLVSLGAKFDRKTIFIRNYKMSVTKVFLSQYFKLLALLHWYFCVQYRFIYYK